MKLRNIKLKFLVVLALLSGSYSFSQNTGPLGELKQVYESIEYNTIAFNDLKQKWMVDDPTLVREIYNRFIVRNALRVNGRPVKMDVVKEKTEYILNSNVVIELRKRYYDDEIEYFAFVPEREVGKDNPQLLYDAVVDGFLLKEIVGQKTYDKIRELSYFSKDVTKKQYDHKFGYYYDVNVNLLQPEVMLWSTTSANRNKYLVSAFGKWGNDAVAYPGWYSSEYIIGTQLTYFKNLSNDPDEFTYKVAVGTGMPAGRPFKGEMDVKRLYVAGQAFYGRLEGYPLEFITSSVKDVLVSLEVKATLTDYKFKDYGTKTVVEDFYANKNYFVLTAMKRNLFNLFDFGMFEAGLQYSSADMNKFRLDPSNYTILDLEKGKKTAFDKYNHFVTAIAGVRKTGGLIQHTLDFSLSYSTDGYGYLGVKALVMLSGSLGFDVRVFQSYGLTKTSYPYRNDTYIVFSPVLRINY